MKKIPVLLFASLLCSCSNAGNSSALDEIKENRIEDDYRNYYEIFVPSFADSDNDGVGDLKGIDDKIDYLADIGYNGIWLTPINSSPSYHKYDIQDYFSVDSSFGTMDDLKNLVRHAHQKKMKVIMDGVFNHSSYYNPWFEKCILAHRKRLLGKSLDDEEKDYESLYVIKDGSAPQDGKIYAKAGANDFYYECNFSGDMPEFDFESEFTFTKIKSVIDYYMSDEIGIDGFRLDAVLYYDFHDTESNVRILDRIAKMVHDNHGYVVGECFDSLSTIKQYYQSGCDSFFYFPGQGNSGFMVESLGMSGGFKKKYLDGMLDMIAAASGHIPAPFLDNHDVPRVTRGGNIRQTKFLLGLRDMLNGSVFNYYGDEIGMSSSKVSHGDYADSNYRTHYYWDDSSHAYETKDVPHANAQTQYYPDSKSQLEDDNSILNYEKHALRMRNTYPAIARGTVSQTPEDEALNQDSQDNLILAFDKTYESDTIRMLFNFSDTQSYTYDMKDKKMADILLVDVTTQPSVEGNMLTLPPYGIALLK